ncbi:ABC transporter permease [Actinomadura roseirufa]|uniref:ABC transporter permease n=1 Tax=Actinomadura roseirufa TaxID=2094049 RepID=UPI001041BA4F|nr:ABC-2 family transporter protein [Actinomadura roseirufa]
MSEISVRAFRRRLQIVRRITGLNLRARLEYRTEFLLAILNGVLWQASVLLFMTVLVTRFSGLAGWSSSEVLFITGFRLLAHALYVCFFLNVTYVPVMIREGRVDAFLARPLPLLTQVLLNSFNVNALGDLCVAATLFGVAASTVPLDWTAPRVCLLVISVAGAVLLEAAIQLLISSAAFRQSETFTLSTWIDELMATFGNYPTVIFPLVLRALFLSVLPIAFIAYLPASVILGEQHRSSMTSILGYAAPAIGLCAFLGARLIWYRSARAYQGNGG